MATEPPRTFVTYVVPGARCPEDARVESAAFPEGGKEGQARLYVDLEGGSEGHQEHVGPWLCR